MNKRTLEDVENDIQSWVNSNAWDQVVDLAPDDLREEYYKLVKEQ